MTAHQTAVFHVCRELSRRGWGVGPTPRGTVGVDLIAYSQDGTRLVKVQVIEGRSSVQSSTAHWIVHVLDAMTDRPRCFIALPHEASLDGLEEAWHRLDQGQALKVG